MSISDPVFGYVSPLTQEQKEYAWSIVKQTDWHCYPENGGSDEQRYVGMLGHVALADLLRVPRPVPGLPDGGVDIELGGENIDIKTAHFKTYAKRDWNSVLDVRQIGKKTTIYFFAGIVNKTDFQLYGYFYASDLQDQWIQKSGFLLANSQTKMTLRNDAYIIPNTKLKAFIFREWILLA